MITKEQAFGMYFGSRAVRIIADNRTFFEVDSIVNVFNICKVGGFNIDYCYLLLRPLSDMTEEEGRKMRQMYINEPFLNYYGVDLDNPQSIGYLISIGIDIFNLKERGWAVYESELKGGGK